MKQVFPYRVFPFGQVWKLVQVWVYSRCYEAGISIPGLPGWTGMEILDVLFQGWYWLFYDVLKENVDTLCAKVGETFCSGEGEKVETLSSG